METVNVLAWILPVVSLTLFVCMFTKWWDSVWIPQGIEMWRWTSVVLSLATTLVLMVQGYLEGDTGRNVFQFIYICMAIVSFFAASHHDAKETQGSKAS